MQGDPFTVATGPEFNGGLMDQRAALRGKPLKDLFWRTAIKNAV